MSICLAVFEPRVSFPVYQVDCAKSPDHELQLPLVEGLEQVLRDEVVEAFLEGQELLLDPMHKPRKENGESAKIEKRLPKYVCCNIRYLINQIYYSNLYIHYNLYIRQ